MTRINDTLNKIFKEYEVVFWYDNQGKMKEHFDLLEMKGVNKVEVRNNEFQIKHRILHASTNERHLLYFPEGEVPMNQNWLLDLQLAYTEFRTDQEAMFLQELGLDYHFKEFVQLHIEFFQSKERRLKFAEMLAPEDSELDLQYKLMAVVFNTEYPNLEAYIQSFASAFIDGNDKVERELERFNLLEHFWRAVNKKFGYQSEKPTIYDFLVDVFSRNFSPTNNGKSMKETRILLSLWMDAISYQDAFRRVSDKVSGDLQIPNMLEKCSLDEIVKEDLFREIDLKIIHLLSYEIAEDSTSLENVLTTVKVRENKYWFSEFIHFYKCLEHSARMLDSLKKLKSFKIESVEEGAAAYANEWFMVDYHFRKFLLYHRQSGQNRVFSLLSDKTTKAYSNAWLLEVNNTFQECIDSRSNWVQSSHKSQSRFFQNYAQPFTQKDQRLFVVISDALRYENGWELHKEIQSEKRYEAELDYMITGLPSYTQLGMAALLPHKQLNIYPKDCSVIADGQSTMGISGRTKVLQNNAGPKAVAINAEDFMKMNTSTEGREFAKAHDLIYIYHNRIDKTGDDKTSEDKVFEAVEEEISFLKSLLRKIANVNGNNILITADHGYIYQPEVLDESEFAEAEAEGEIWKTNRRFIIGSNLKSSNALKKFNGNEIGLTGDVDVLITKGINRLRVKGAGSRFVHGGASLQEIVVPVIRVVKKREDTTAQVEIDIIKSTDKITTNILPVSFLQNDLVSEKVLPRQIRSFIQANDGTTLSDIFNYSFDASEGSMRQREVKHRFQLSSLASGKYKNERVALVLEEPIEGTSKWKQYKSYLYTLSISFSNDFDEF